MDGLTNIAPTSRSTMALDVDLLRAWIAGFPFGAEAYAQRIFVLRTDADGTIRDRATRVLAHTAERWVSVRAHGRSIDGIAHLRSDVWFGRGPRLPMARRVGLATLLANVAESVLDYDGRSLVLRQNGQAKSEHECSEFSENAARFRWLTLVFPYDVLVAAYCARHKVSPSTTDIRFGSIALERLLASGAAETHMHVNNGVDPLFLWLRWLRQLSRSPDMPTMPEPDEPFAPPLGSFVDLERAGLAAALIRRGLYSHFGGTLPSDTVGTWSLSQQQQRPESRIVRRRANAIKRSKDILLRGLTNHPRNAQIDAELRLAYQEALRLSISSKKPRGALRDSDWRDDALLSFGVALRDDGRPGVEFDLMVRALTTLLEAEKIAEEKDEVTDAMPEEHELFWQYLRLRLAIHRYLTQEPGVAGLDWFRYWDRRLKLFYSKQDRARSASNAFSLHNRGVPLVAMEVRVPPESTTDDAYSLFERTLDSALETIHGLGRAAAAERVLARKDSLQRLCPPLPRPGMRCEIGLVLHFTKRASEMPSNTHAMRKSRAARVADDPLRGQLVRYEEWLRTVMAEASVIDTMFRRHPLLTVLVRGFDIAARELTMPTWPTLVPLALARASARRACEAALAKYPEVEITPIRTTYQVGEDYRRNVEGLRRIHELLEFGVLGANDRIGHGLALGDDIERRFREQPVVYQPAEDRLDDLLWELDRYQRGDLPDESGRTNVIRGEIDHLVRAVIYQRSAPSPLTQLAIDKLAEAGQREAAEHVRQWFDNATATSDDHLAARRHRHDATLITQWVRQLSTTSLAQLAARYPLLRMFLSDRGVIERGQIPVRVECSNGEMRFALAAQRWLREIIAVRQITIESNPSSNLLVGNYHQFPDLPTFRMHPLPSQRVDMPTLPLSINTDDPLTFATHLGREYEYVFASLLRAKVPTEEALAWIDGVRVCGKRSRFTVASSADPEVLLRLRHQISPYTNADRRSR
jgi:hypothetical protein